MNTRYLLALALSACSAAPFQAPEVEQPETLSLCADPELIDVTRAAADRWREAAGVDVVVHDECEAGDVPVYATAEIDDGLMGQAYLALSEIRIRPDVLDSKWLHTVVVHEIGHVLRDNGDHLHDSVGIMREGDEQPSIAITEADISFVCAGAYECRWDEPEELDL